MGWVWVSGKLLAGLVRFIGGDGASDAGEACGDARLRLGRGRRNLKPLICHAGSREASRASEGTLWSHSFGLRRVEFQFHMPRLDRPSESPEFGLGHLGNGRHDCGWRCGGLGDCDLRLDARNGLGRMGPLSLEECLVFLKTSADHVSIRAHPLAFRGVKVGQLFVDCLCSLIGHVIRLMSSPAVRAVF